jgi:hypothetical protein
MNKSTIRDRGGLVQAYFKQFVSSDTMMQKYRVLDPFYKEIVDFLIDYDVASYPVFSYKVPKIHELTIIGRRTQTNVFFEGDFEVLHKAIKDPLELNLTDPSALVRLIGEYKAGLITKQDPQIQDMIVYLRRPTIGDPPPWQK